LCDIVKSKGFGKNPDVDTSFLPDKEREEQEKLEREALKKEWLEQQERIKEQEIEITYSFWDGTGHRKAVKVRAADLGMAIERERERERECRNERE
jgi:protein FAM50